MGVVSALLRFCGVNLVNDTWFNSSLAELLSLGAYILLIAYFIQTTRKK